MNWRFFTKPRVAWLVGACGVVAATALLFAAAAAPEHGHADHKDDHHEHGERGHDDPGHDGHADEVKLTAEAIEQHRIRVGPVTRRALRPTFTAPARLALNGEAVAHVGCAVKGRVAELRAKVGDAVKQGDVLLVVESPELGEAQLDFVQKRAAVGAAGLLFEAAQSSLERAKKLYDGSQGITLAELQKRETELKTAAVNVRAARTAATAAGNRLRLLGMGQAEVDQLAETEQIHPQFAVRTPIGGRVTEREVTLGELVAPEDDRLLVVADMTKLWVLADVPEARLKGLKPQSEARVTLAAMPGEKLAGVVSFFSHAVDPATRTATVRVEVDNPDGQLRPGMFGSVEITAGGDDAGAHVLAVPDEAVQTVEGGPAVFVPVEGEENTFARRAVTVGNRVGDWVPVLSGLKEGDPVVVSGTFVLKADLGKAGAAHEH
jgi:cobalt-zinc-cadmium efflux system membrane fusion protein